MFGRSYSALGISLAVHLVLLGVMGALKMAVEQQSADVVVESVFNEERVQEQFSQDVDYDTAVSQTLSITGGGGGVVTGHIGAAAGAPIAAGRVAAVQAIADPKVRMP